MRNVIAGISMFTAGMCCCASIITEGYDLEMIGCLVLTLVIGIRELMAMRRIR